MNNNNNQGRTSATQTPDEETPAYRFPLHKINFIIMAVAALIIVAGFVLISGGGSKNGEFNPEVFSTARIVVGPTLAFLGFILMGAGIMWKSK